MAITTPSSEAKPARLGPGRAISAAAISTAGTTQQRAPRQTVGTWACLVLSDDSQRRRLLEQAATAAGWDPVPCASVGEAMQSHKRWRTQLAAVDLGAMNAVSKSAYLQFSTRLTSRDRLLLVCDEPAGTDGELLARQAGAWMYLPTPEFGAPLISLFVEAKLAAEKAADAAFLSDREPAGAASRSSQGSSGANPPSMQEGRPL
ncbi:hypothetical protein Pla108_35070 [Botrimarina colliarenosi]|uniref:Response regulatory domain-containing protein n=1 Tax=Botrimarina colliarenosi TaxID=2528001 RepID=A0A5C6A7J2_9BACT|nr:hypothetical protein [Botrimarina colliarenosi]TWT95360.1 hypothetical protein Pla108_35070 [Botrimarina colliarenosi]